MMDIEQFKNNTNRISNAEIEEKKLKTKSNQALRTENIRILPFTTLPKS